VDSTRRAWDLTARAKYARELEADVARLRAGESELLPIERQALGDLRWCGRAIHLQCSHGQDALSLWQLGAREVVGVDFSREMLELAREKSARLGAPARWIESDVLAVPAELDGTAGLVYTGKGALCWVRDVDAWAHVIARLLRPGGRLFVFEAHPLTWVWDHEAADWRLRADGGDYFAREPRANRHFPASAVDDATPPGAIGPIAWEYQWTLGAIVSALADAGLRLRALSEHPENFWPQFRRLEPAQDGRLPQSFSLWAERD
jgi:SAM-dependent methyltransferase